MKGLEALLAAWGRARAAWARLPEGFRVALGVYLTVRLPLELLLMAAHGTLPYGPGALGMPPLEGPSWLNAWLRWDSGWYVRIIRDGFSYAPCLSDGVPCRQASIAFLPVFPYLVRGVMQLGLGLPAASFLVTHVALVLALWGMWELGARLLTSPAASQRAMVALLVFPTAIFLSAGYAEVLFIAIGVWALLCFERNQAVAAALLLAAAALTRSQGMLLAGAVGAGALWGRKWRLAVATGVVVGAAVGAYLWWQQRTFGDALAFLHARRGWGFSGQPAFEHISQYWYRTRTWQLAMEGWFDFLSIPWLLVCGVLAWRRFGVAYGLFILSILGVAMQAGQVWALGRIALCAVPCYLLLAEWTGRRVLARLLFVTGVVWVTLGGVRYVHGFFTGA